MRALAFSGLGARRPGLMRLSGGSYHVHPVACLARKALGSEKQNGNMNGSQANTSTHLHNDQALTDLLLATARGDEAAFARLYALSAGRLHALALRLLRRADWAEEVVQDSFVAIWKHAKRYEPERGAALAWMGRIVRNRCLDQLRRPREEQDEDDQLAAQIPSDTPDPLSQLAATREAQALAECMKRLEEKQRKLILAAFFDGLSHAELAQALALPLGTVKTWIRRGMERLRGCLSV